MLKLPSFDDLRIHLHPSGFSASLPAPDPKPPSARPAPLRRRPAGLGRHLARALGALRTSGVPVVLGVAALLHGAGASRPAHAATPAAVTSPRPLQSGCGPVPVRAAAPREVRDDSPRPGAGRAQEKRDKAAAPAGPKAPPEAAAPQADPADEPWRHQGVGFGAPASRESTSA